MMTPDKGFLSRSHVSGIASLEMTEATARAFARLLSEEFDEMAKLTERDPSGAVSRPRWFTEMSLTDSLRFGECLVCSNLAYAERRGIYSFLWEGMMSNHARTKFLEGGGFCPRHFWMAKRIEDEGWPAGGIGVALLCENLIEAAIRDLALNPGSDSCERSRVFFWKKKTSVRPPVSACMFCADWVEREESLIEALESLKDKPQWSKALEESPLCAHHVGLARAIWKNSEDREQVAQSLELRLRELQADLKEWIGKHDWNRRGEPLGREQGVVERAIRVLAGLARQFPLCDPHRNRGRNDAA
jgi:hypothetical protein